MRNKKLVQSDVKTAIKRLHLFNEKAAELRTSNYIKQAPSQHWSLSWSADTGTTTITDVRPEEEARRAMILTLRFFENKELSLKAIVSLYQDLPISEEWKTWASGSAQVFQDDMKAVVIPALDGKSFTPALLFKTFMYGQYCHSEEPFVEILQVFARSPMFSFYQQAFDALLVSHLKFINWLSNLNEQIIIALEKEVDA